jgi:hypothetical protein
MNAFAQTTLLRGRRRNRQRNRDEVPQQREKQKQSGGQATHTLKLTDELRTVREGSLRTHTKNRGPSDRGARGKFTDAAKC